MKPSQEQPLEGFRLSPQQKRVWALHQNAPIYPAQCAVLIEGPMQPEALERAAQNVVGRHEILRTRFEYRPGVKHPFQVVLNSVRLLWENRDWTSLGSSQQDSEIDRLFQAREEGCLALEPAHNSPLRFSFITLSKDKHLLFLRLSPLCADTVTLDNLVGEIFHSYEACLKGEEPDEDVLQYVDYCAWLEEVADSADEEVLSARTYWQNQSQLPGLTFKLPFQRRGGPDEKSIHKSLILKLGTDSLTALDRTAQQRGATTSHFLFACWSVLLQLVTGQPEVINAVEFPGRSHKELHKTLGLFSQWLPVRSHFGRDYPFSRILAQLDATMNEAERWQDYPIADVIEMNRIGIGFSFEEWPRKEQVAGVSYSIIQKHVSTGRFDLQVGCIRSSNSLSIHFSYDSVLFESGDIDRLAGQFQTVLKSASHNPETSIHQLEILGPLEREQILVNFNNSPHDNLQRQTTAGERIHERFHEQAARTPDRIAVVYEDGQLTYGELEKRSNQLAGYLQSLGVGAETLAAIHVERSLDLVVALLGVLKAGGGYVPLDTGLPKERLSVILHNTAARVIITQGRLARELPDYDGHVVHLDADWPAISEHDLPLVSSSVGANLAYVLFTSGSTGTPKGVAIEHRQLLNYVDAILERLNLPCRSSYACVSTFAADLGNTAIFPALCSGGCLHIVSQARASDPDALAQYFSLHDIDCLKIVPSHLEALLSGSQPEKVLPKRRLVLGGEAASWDLVKKVETLAPNCLVLNHYGPTEATVGATTYRAIGDQRDCRTLSVPIGSPIANGKVHVLNSCLQPVPIWTPGEIYIGGAGLARGYLNRPDLTAERFIPSPFSPGGRLYRTGDVGRYLPDGSVEFLGRTDHQIKIRGFRVELGEIEAVLREHPIVHQAVVTVREETPGEKRINAYIVARHPVTDSPGKLREFLKTRLPDYMVPSAFVMLDALPLTSNGKVDRSRLPEPPHSDEAIEKRSASLMNPVELVLAGIFAEMLHIDRVDADSDFFDLGGHSLLAIQVLSQIRRLLNVDLPLRALFEKPTVGGMASAILTDPLNAERIESTAHHILKSSSAQSSIPISPCKDRDFVPLSPTQEQMWFIDQLAPGGISYNMAHAFHLKGQLHLSALERSLSEIVRRHESLRTTFASIDGVPLQRITPSLTVALPVIELSNLSDREKAAEALRVATEHARHPFDLGKGPLLRLNLLKHGREEHTLLIAMHHIISDGWSWGVFLKELSVLYQAFSQEKPSPLPELMIQYADFAEWQHERLKGLLLEDRLSYWAQQLDNAPALLELPTDRPRGAVQSFRGATYSEMLPQVLREKLGILGREEGATLFMTLCAAFNILLFRWTGQQDVVLGSTIAGRDRAELEPLIGLFINTLILRTDLSGNPTFRELLRRVRETALGAYAHQEVPFDKLMERLHSKRSLSHGTLFQVLFILHQGTSQQELELSGLAVAKVPVEMGTVKFALSVSMVEDAQGLSCSFTYQTDLFDSSTIQRMVAQFQTLLRSVVANPNAHLSELPVLSDAERLEMVVTWNSTKKDFPVDKCIHDLFSEQVLRTPDATAVVFDDERLSYGQLDRKANQLARRLQDGGVSPGALVVICMDRCLDLIVAVLAVLKAGAAYVPLDPKYSIERLGWVLRDTAAPVLLTHQRILATLPKDLSKDKCEVICLDTTYTDGCGGAVVHELSPHHLAYVIYTSGSTGTAKGVEITHRSLVNFVVSSAATFELLFSDRVLQFASLSFDTAMEEIFPCLIRGATLVLRTDRMLDSASGFLQQCREWGITVLDLPTVYWHELTESITSEGLVLPETLRLVILGGDKALPERVAQWQMCSRGRVRLLNEYGPTETTVVATTHDLSAFPPADAQLRDVPIGRPIANAQTYILDRELNPVPIGVCGELHIGGLGLARAYHGRPDLTAESFIPNPFSDAGERLYRTGDLARYLPDGTIAFLGRSDRQAKVRGFRVEPAEVEAILIENAMVRQVVVVTQPIAGGDNRLVAFVVLASACQTTAQELRGFLKTRLPEYMLPSVFVFLDSLPLTASGKVDRQALPDPRDNKSESQQSFVAARTPLEQELIDEWEKLLDTRPIGTRDNFFDLGGHSLLGVRLIARIEKRFGKSLPVAVLFESPTIEQLALVLDQTKWPESWSSLIPVQPKGSKVPFFWVHGDSSNVLLPAYLGADQPLYGLEHQSQDGRRALYTRVDEMAEHYLKEVLTVRGHGPYLLGGYSFGAVVAFEMAQQLGRDGEEVALLFMLDPPGKIEIEKPCSITDEVQEHLRKIALLGPRDKLAYVLPRVKAMFRNKVNARIAKRIQEMRLKSYIAGGRILPPSLRSAYILQIYRQALSCYVPQQYAGRVILMNEEERSYQSRLDWAMLVTGDLEIHEMRGDHMDLRIEPYARVWAERLKESLNRVQDSLSIRTKVFEHDRNVENR